MAADPNTVTIGGRLVHDIELRHTNNGTPVTRIRLGSTTRGKKGDDWFDKSNYFDVVVWGALAKICTDYLERGRYITVEGRLEFSEWEKDGQKRSTVEIVARDVYFGPGGPASGSSGQDDGTDLPAPQNAAPSTPPDDDIPF